MLLIQMATTHANRQILRNRPRSPKDDRHQSCKALPVRPESNRPRTHRPPQSERCGHFLVELMASTRGDYLSRLTLVDFFLFFFGAPLSALRFVASVVPMSLP